MGAASQVAEASNARALEIKEMSAAKSLEAAQALSDIELDHRQQRIAKQHAMEKQQLDHEISLRASRLCSLNDPRRRHPVTQRTSHKRRCLLLARHSLSPPLRLLRRRILTALKRRRTAAELTWPWRSRMESGGKWQVF